MTAQERAEKIINGLGLPANTYDFLWSKIAAELEAYGRDFAAEMNTVMHQDIYWQAGEIQKLIAELEKAKAEGRRAGLEEAITALRAVPGDAPIGPSPKLFAIGIINKLITTEANEGEKK